MGKIHKYMYDSVVIKNLPANAGDARDVGSTPGSGRPPEIGISQYPCLENAMNREAWLAVLYGVAKSGIRLREWARAHTYIKRLYHQVPNKYLITRVVSARGGSHCACMNARSYSHVRLCDLMDYSLLGSSGHRILKARILEWAAIPSFGGSSQPRDQTVFSCGYWNAGRYFLLLSHQGSPDTHYTCA